MRSLRILLTVSLAVLTVSCGSRDQTGQDEETPQGKPAQEHPQKQEPEKQEPDPGKESPGQTQEPSSREPGSARKAWRMEPTLPIPNDAKVYVALDRQSFFLGEVVALRYTIENTGEKEFSANFGRDYRGSVRSLRFEVTVTGADGKTLPDPYPSGFCMGGMSSNWRVKPGEKLERELMLHRYARIDKAGKYKVRVYHDLGWIETEDMKVPHPEIDIEFVMPDKNQARRIVNDILKAQKRAPDFTALRYAVYLPYLLEPAREGDGRVLAALKHIPTPEATKALIELLGDCKGDFAVNAGRALNYRIPEPHLQGNVPVPGDSAGQSEDESSYVQKRSWKPEFTDSIRGKAEKFLSREDAEGLVVGAVMLKRVGKIIPKS